MIKLSDIRTITIVGLGLMGGSLASVCRKKFPKSRIIGVSRSREARQAAIKKKWIHAAFEDITAALVSDLGGSARQKKQLPEHLIVLATPVDTFPNLLSEIEVVSKNRVVVTDVGSVKGEIVKFAEGKKFKKVIFVGAHPMAGSHERGFDSCHEDLYEHGYTFLTRTKKTDSTAYRAVKDFWIQISPKIIEVDPLKHDQIVSAISHLPHAVAACLASVTDPVAIPFAASGFRDTTRVAAGHSSLWAPIFLMNRKAVVQSLSRFENQIKFFKDFLQRGDRASLVRILEDASKKLKK